MKQIQKARLRGCAWLLAAAPVLAAASEPMVPVPATELAPPAATAPVAQPPVEVLRLRQRALAAVCANCHGTDGRGAPGALIPTLAGMPRDYMLEQFEEFRDGSRPATVMPQIVKGLTPAQLEQLATYFSRIRRLPEDTP
jgi:cytochrome c553